MTIRELYDWAKEHDVLDYKVEVKYRDDGGEYYGQDEELYLDINAINKQVIL